MIKQEQYSFKGLMQDIAKNKNPKEFYFDAFNIRITNIDSQSSFSVINEKGNSKSIEIPEVTITPAPYQEKTRNPNYKTISYNNYKLKYSTSEIENQISSDLLPTFSNTQKILQVVPTREEFIIFTTDEKMDCIWITKNLLNSQNIELHLLYCRNIGLSINNPIQALYNYENENIAKVYWVDGNNQIRFINVNTPFIYPVSLSVSSITVEYTNENINIPKNNLDFVGNILFSQPKIIDYLSGGIHTSGKIQYAYNLYRLNNSQTKISPFSELIPLDKGVNGGELNEVVGSIPVIKISNIDLSYSHIKIYAIKYTSYNEIPQISLIEERELSNTPELTIYDDGRIISTLSLEEFLFLGSNPIVPKHIEIKDNRLFISNIKDNFFDMPDEFDARAYSFPLNSTTTQVVDNPTNFTNQLQGVIANINNNFNLPLKHDAINRNYKTQKYTYNSNVLGGEGKYIKYILKTDLIEGEYNTRNKYFKDNEIYRIGIEFYNNLGQISLPKWIADFVAPEGNLRKRYNKIEVQLKPAFYTWLNSYNFKSENDKPVGYRIIRADRTLSDRTIICQGGLGTMMVNVPTSDLFLDTVKKRQKSDEIPKMPNFTLRTLKPELPLQAASHLKSMELLDGQDISDLQNNVSNFVDDKYNPLTEVQYSAHKKKATTFQYTKMFQMYSPEVMFENVSLSAGLKMRVVGGFSNNLQNYAWIKEIKIDNRNMVNEIKTINKLHPSPLIAGNVVTLAGTAAHIMDRGMISNTNGEEPDRDVDFIQFYRKFNQYRIAQNNIEKFIYGTPEIVERGQGVTTYNNDGRFKYTNNLEGFLTDGIDKFAKKGDVERAIINLNSYGAKNITFVLGNSSSTNILGNSSTDSWNRDSYESLYLQTAIGQTDALLIGEIIKPESIKYLGNIYGGNSYEDKKRTDYIKIGDYKNINENAIVIDSPGDTFVHTFKFLRINKTDKEIYSSGVNQLSEIVEFPIETTVDLKNRNDNSIAAWDDEFMSSYEDYHKYNRVYSQESNLVKSTDFDFTFQRVKNFDTRIQSTKLKIPNETIDSWSDVLVNERLDLNGKYGPINALVNFNDNIFAFQDKSFAIISINPRVQVMGQDGIQTELGKGAILDDYKYISTKSGSINKWSIITTPNGMYFFDSFNKSWNKFSDKLIGLTDNFGLHSFINNNFDYDIIKVDNPLIKKGVSTGYNPITNDVYLTLLQENKSFTVSFNEMTNSFVSFHSYKPSIYVNNGDKFFTINPDNNSLYLQNKGEYGKFYEELYDWYITFLMNPQGRDCLFNNLEYKAETYNVFGSDIKKTFDKIHVWNEYQNTNEIDLTLNSNLNRKFRNWRLIIPRAKDINTKQINSLDRVRGHWAYVKLISNNQNNYKMIFHEPILHYTLYGY